MILHMCTWPNSQCEQEEIVSVNRKKYVYQVTQFSSKSAHHLSGEVMQSREISWKSFLKLKIQVRLKIFLWFIHWKVSSKLRYMPFNLWDSYLGSIHTKKKKKIPMKDSTTNNPYLYSHSLLNIQLTCLNFLYMLVN